MYKKGLKVATDGKCDDNIERNIMQHITTNSKNSIYEWMGQIKGLNATVNRVVTCEDFQGCIIATNTTYEL